MTDDELLAGVLRSVLVHGQLVETTSDPAYTRLDIMDAHVFLEEDEFAAVRRVMYGSSMLHGSFVKRDGTHTTEYGPVEGTP